MALLWLLVFFLSWVGTEMISNIRFVPFGFCVYNSK